MTYFAPDIDTKGIIAAVGKARNADVDSKAGAGATRLESATDAKVFWRLNSDRFVREFRDATIVQAVTKRIDSSAGKEEQCPLHALLYLRVWSLKVSTQNLGQLRVFSTHFEKN